jgi:hypothetical protein
MLKMICYDLKTVIIEYVHDDGQIKEISEWVKVCQWNRSNLIKLIKYKDWREDYMPRKRYGFKGNSIYEYETESKYKSSEQCVYDTSLKDLYETKNKYKHDFFQFRDDYDIIKLMLHTGDLFITGRTLHPTLIKDAVDFIFKIKYRVSKKSLGTFSPLRNSADNYINNILRPVKKNWCLTCTFDYYTLYGESRVSIGLSNTMYNKKYSGSYKKYDDDMDHDKINDMVKNWKPLC